MTKITYRSPSQKLTIALRALRDIATKTPPPDMLAADSFYAGYAREMARGTIDMLGETPSQPESGDHHDNG